MSENKPKNKRLYPRDIFNAGCCATGLVSWAESNGINYSDWVKNGLCVIELAKWNDAQVDRIIKKVLGVNDGR